MDRQRRWCWPLLTHSPSDARVPSAGLGQRLDGGGSGRAAMPPHPRGPEKLRTIPPAASCSPVYLSSHGPWLPFCYHGSLSPPRGSTFLPATLSAPHCPPQSLHLLFCFPDSHPSSLEAPGPTLLNSGSPHSPGLALRRGSGKTVHGNLHVLGGLWGSTVRLPPPLPPPSSLPGLEPPTCLGCGGLRFLAELEALSPMGGPVWVGLPGGLWEVGVWVGI